MGVYFIQRASDKAIKIGFSSAEKLRAQKIRAKFRQDVYLLGMIKDGTYSDESALHKRFKRFNIEKEWFYPVAEIYHYIISHASSGVIHYPYSGRPKYGNCKGVNKSGGPCHARQSKKTGYCHWHTPRD